MRLSPLQPVIIQLLVITTFSTTALLPLGQRKKLLPGCWLHTPGAESRKLSYFSLCDNSQTFPD